MFIKLKKLVVPPLIPMLGATRTFWTVRPDNVVLPVTLRPVETPNPAPVSVTPALDRVEDRAPFAAD
jgi:hypothetical protein